MRIGMIGCGNMGSAVVKGLSAHHEMLLYDHNKEKAEALAKAGHGKVCSDLAKMASDAEMIILAVKPFHLESAAKDLSKHVKKEQWIVSLLGGTPLAKLKKAFPVGKIVHMMPNLAVMHGQGVMGFCAEEGFKDEEVIAEVFKPLGKGYWLPEEKVNALAALAGSGPAFVFVMIEAMVEAGITMGFSAAQAQEMACQMMQGSLALLQALGQPHPGALKWQVCSPKGTTIAGVRKLEEKGLRSAIIETLIATYEKGAVGN